MATRKKSKTKKKSRSTEDDRSVTYEEAMYNLLCKVYGPPTSLIQKPKTAAQKNKLTYRSAAGMEAYQQTDEAEKLDSALVKRAEVEALNIADRTGGALDL